MQKLIVVFGLLFLLSCSSSKQTIQEVPMVYTSLGTERNSTKDSVIIRDSVILQFTDSGKYLRTEHYEYHYESSHDTVTHTDSIPFPVKVEIEKVVNDLTLWQKVLQGLGYFALIIIGSTLLNLLLKLKK